MERHFQHLAGPINVSVYLKYDVLCFVSVCVWHTRLSREKLRLEVCISGWNSTRQPYIESTTVLSDYYDEESQVFVVSVGLQKALPALSWTYKCEFRLEI